MTRPSQLPEQVLDHSKVLAITATQQALAAVGDLQTTTSDLINDFGPSRLFSQQILADEISQAVAISQADNEPSPIERIEATAIQDNELLHDQPVLETNEPTTRPSSNESASDSIEQVPEMDEITNTDFNQTDSEEITKTSSFAGRESLRSQLTNKEKYFGELEHRIEELTASTHSAQDKYEQAKADPHTSTEKLISLKEEADQFKQELDDVRATSWTVKGEVEQATSSLEAYEQASQQDTSSSQTVSTQKEATQSAEAPNQAAVSVADFFQDEPADQDIQNKQKELAQQIQEESQKNRIDQTKKALLEAKLKEIATQEQLARKEQLERLEKAGDVHEETQQEQEAAIEAQSDEQETQKREEEQRLKEKTELEARQKAEEDERRVQQEEAAKEAARLAAAEVAEQERLRAELEDKKDKEDSFDPFGRGVLWMATVPPLMQLGVAAFMVTPAAAVAAALLAQAALARNQQNNQGLQRWW